MGNEIICINNNTTESLNYNSYNALTLYKIYYVLKYDKYQKTVLIENNNGDKVWYNETRFINIIEDRKNKINKIKESICSKKGI